MIDPATTTPLGSNSSGDGWHLPPTRRWTLRPQPSARLYADGRDAGLLLPVRGTRAAAGRGILLQPDGVAVRTEGDSAPIEWQRVFDFRPHWVREAHRQESVRNWLTVDLGGQEASPRVDASTLRPDPWLALAVLRYYLDHPKRRSELTTHDAVARVTTLMASVRPPEQA